MNNQTILKESDVYSGVRAEVHDFYMSDSIGPPTDYMNWLHIIRNSRANDVIRIHINSPGGDLYTTVQLVDAIKGSNANVIGCVEGQCASAATIVFLACDAYYVSPYSMFMFHTYSAGMFGKSSDIYSKIEFKRKFTDFLFEDTYEHVLTKAELDKMKSGTDIWIDAEEMAVRLNNRNDARLKEIEEDKPKPRRNARKTKSK